MTSELRAQVYAYLNPFAATPRIEVLVDWSDDWAWPDPAWLTRDISFHLYLFGTAYPPSFESGFDPLEGSEVAARALPFLEGANADGAGSAFRTSVLNATQPFQRVGDFEFSNFARDLLDGHPTSETFRNAPHFYFTAAPYIQRIQYLEEINAGDEAKIAAYHELVRGVADVSVGHADRLLSFRKSLPTDPGRRTLTSPRDAVATLRSAAREEATLGHLFRVLFYLDADIASWWKPSSSGTSPIGVPRPSRLWLVARPFVGGSTTPEPLSRFLPVPTRLGLMPASLHSASLLSKVVTVLHALNEAGGPEDPARECPEENVCGFWAESVGAHVVDGDDLLIRPDRMLLGGGSTSAVVTAATIKSALLKHRNLAPLVSREDLDKAALRLWEESETGKAETAARPSRVAAKASGNGQLSGAAQAWIAERVSAAASLNASRPRFDAIGVAWPFPTPQPSGYHRGFKGYRLDVSARLPGDTAYRPWTSLCRLQRRALGPESWRVLECDDQDRFREGVVTQSVMGDATQPKPTRFVAPRDFVWWSAPSVIKPYPLDRLGTLDKNETANDPIKLEELAPKDLHTPTYGASYRFAVRNVGLSGMSPRTGEPPECPRADAAMSPLSSIDPFLRTIPIAAPAVAVDVSSGQWERVDPVPRSEEDETKVEQTSVDGVWKVKGSEPRVRVLALAPIAHYKVALHARGANEDDVADADLKTRFEAACLRYARDAATALARGGQGPAPFAKALDPHLHGVELVSRTWYPFSDSDPILYTDRYVPTGRQLHAWPDIAERGFVELFVQGQRLAEAGRILKLPTETHVEYRTVLLATVAGSPGLMPQDAALRHEPVILPGLRNKLECRGVWDAEARRLTRWRGAGPPDIEYSTAVPAGQSVADGREAWTASLIVFGERVVPLGGKVDLSKGRATATAVTYSGLADPLRERVLLPPPTAPGSTPETAPARSTVIAWRRHAFKDAAILGGNRDVAYRDFVARLLGTPPTLVSLKHGPKADADFLEVILAPIDDDDAFVAPGFSLPTPVQVALTDKALTATIGSGTGERRLPFVDDDIAHVVRLTWSVPLDGSHIERPRDLAAVKEFALYRTRRGETPGHGEVPRARIPRPPDSVFNLDLMDSRHAAGKHLDKVEWTWVDAVEDRDLHEYDYHVVAVPEHPESFSAQPWFRIPVTIPCADLEPRSARVVPLPLMTKESKDRRLGFYLPRCEDLKRTAKGRLAWRLLSVAADPLVEPGAAGQESTSINPYKPTAHTDIFPATSPAPGLDAALPEAPYDLDLDGWRWAEVAEEVQDPCEARPEAPQRPEASCESAYPHLPVHVVRFDPRAHGALFKLNGPFFKLQLQVYLGDRFPRLRHTLATETFESDWLQCYPEPLPLAEFGDHGVILQRSNPAGSNLRYRFHLFVAAPAGHQGTAFQLESFYRLAPRLTTDTLQEVLKTTLPRFVGAELGELRLFVLAEEGFALESYWIEGDSAAMAAEPWFVVLRSSPSALELLARNEGGTWSLELPKH